VKEAGRNRNIPASRAAVAGGECFLGRNGREKAVQTFCIPQRAEKVVPLNFGILC